MMTSLWRYVNYNRGAFFAYPSQSAQELFGATWGHELAQALDKCDKLLAEMESNGEDALQRPTILEVVKKLRGAMQDIWKPTSSNDPFIIGYEFDLVLAARC